MKISLTNSKLGSAIPSINLPVSICRADAPCKGNGCYACKGRWLFPNVQQSMENNLQDFLQDSEKFFNDIAKFVSNETIEYKFFRWFGSGDIVNEKFFLGMIKVANLCPNTKFLCFTKKYEIVNKYLDYCNTLPKNLTVIFSTWDRSFQVPNPYGLPMSYIEFTDKSKNLDIPQNAEWCGGNCQECKKCWKLQKGESVVFKKH